MADTPTRRPRRQVTDEFKAGVVRLVLDEGKTVGAVAREMDLTETAVPKWVKRARARKRFRSTTMTEHDQAVAGNVLARQFEAQRPNERWVGDTTEFVIGSSGKFYLAAILDLYSRSVVGWALSAVNDRHLTLRALEMALKRRCPDAGLLHHSDQGCTYASEDYRARLEQHGITCSMSRRGNCYDDAVTGKLVLDGEERRGRALRKLRAREGSLVRLHRRCSISSGAGIRRSGRSARRNSNDAPQPRSRWGARRQPRAHVGGSHHRRRAP